MPTTFDLSENAKHELININNINQPIYRVYEVSRLIDVFENKELSLVKPRLWDDPYDNFLKYATGIVYFRGKEGNYAVSHSYNYYHDQIFGQCWTINCETDATWRVYSPMCDRVKVKTTIEKLSKFINRYNDDNLYTYIGTVKYEKQEKIESKRAIDIANNPLYHFIDSDSLIRKYYFSKRDVFEYENEVRLMICLPQKKENEINSVYQDPRNLDICRFPLNNPEDFFDEIVFDPRMQDSLVRAFTSYFKFALNFKKDIHKSKLYEKPYVKVEFKI